MEYIQNIELSISSDKKSKTGNIQLDKKCIDEEYLIVNKKVYINNIKPMDCLLISKALN